MSNYNDNTEYGRDPYDKIRDEQIDAIASLFRTLPDDIKKLPVSRLGIGEKAADVLSDSGIITIGQLFGDERRYDADEEYQPSYTYRPSESTRVYTDTYTDVNETHGSSADTRSYAGSSEFTYFSDTARKEDDVYTNKTGEQASYESAPKAVPGILNNPFESTLVGAPVSGRETDIRRPDPIRADDRFSGVVGGERSWDRQASDPVAAAPSEAFSELPYSIKKMSITHMNIDTRAINALMRNRITTIGVLATMKRSDLLALKNMGESTADRIMEELALLFEKKENYFKI